MLKICLVFWESEPQYAYKRYAYKKTTCISIEFLRLTSIRITKYEKNISVAQMNENH